MSKKSDWLSFIRRHLLAAALLNLAWEVAQLPLYTIWHDSTWPKIAFAAVHCTLGDIVIAALALTGAVLILGRPDWPHDQYVSVATLAVAAGVAYTFASEWSNVYVRAAWAYSEAMPRLPLVGIGLSPVLQWLLIPSFLFRLLRPL